MSPSDGFTTCILRREFIKSNQINETPEILSLNAQDNTTDRLYFWQLFSILGEDEITEIITTFYRDVLTDNDDELFRDTFKNSGTLEYHVKKQANFWIDVTGGEARLELHHDNAKIIMNTRGASRWLFHMKNVIDSRKFNDKRIIPCLIEFINFFMNKYGKSYNFKAKL